MKSLKYWIFIWASKSTSCFFLLDRFPKNLGLVSDGQGEALQKDIKDIEQKHKVRWDSHMMADYYLTIMIENISSEQKRGSKKMRFLPEPWQKSDVSSLFIFSEHFYLYSTVLWDYFVQFSQKSVRNVMEKVLHFVHFLHCLIYRKSVYCFQDLKFWKQ